MRKIILLAYCFCALSSWAQMLPYQNSNLSSEQRAKDLISRLTLKEKSLLMCDESEAIPRLGIKKFYWWSEGLHGIGFRQGFTVFPEPIGMAASFNDQLIYQVFNAVSDEARSQYHTCKESTKFAELSIFTPNINIFRDPRWGRGEETYGEDPYLTARMGLAVVKGLQGPETSKYVKLLACAKHFAVHSGPEATRHKSNVTDVDPRDLWETYLPAFKSLVQEGKVREVMCAYTRFEDEPCCGSNRLLQQILRNEWGYKYMVVSDCGAISDFWKSHKVSSDDSHAAAKAVLAGTDVECGNDGNAYLSIADAVNKGLLEEKQLDVHLIRLLTERFDLGEMDKDALVPWSKIPRSVINSKEHQSLALDAARQSMTLLQNKNGILPLNKSIKKIAVIGPNADEDEVLWGNYFSTPVSSINILKGIENKIGRHKIIYEKGCDINGDRVYISELPLCKMNSHACIQAMYWNNANQESHPASKDNINRIIDVTTFGGYPFNPAVNKDVFSARYETIYKPLVSGEKTFSLDVLGNVDLLINGKSIYKNDNSNRLYSEHKVVTYNFEKGNSYEITLNFSHNSNRTSSLKFEFGYYIPFDLKALLTKLKKIDTVIFVGGISNKIEGESRDRRDIELPDIQRHCLQALKSAGKKVILVNCSGSAVALYPETESCDAILQAWYGGEKAGIAVADVLFGDYNPSGKLPITFYKNTSQIPDYENYSMKGRTYRYLKDAPLFPFGYGLSYTTFDVGTAKADRTEINVGESMNLTIPIVNTGKCNGSEVIQVYMHKIGDSEGPIKTLRAFKRVDVEMGKRVDISIRLAANTFECFDANTNTMRIVPGDYELMYGTSSDVKDLKMIKVTLH